MSKKLLAIAVLTVAITLGLNGKNAQAATSPSLGTADSFSILAGTEITNVPTSSISGDVGLSPATGAGIGLTAAQVTGTIYSVDAAGPSGSVVNPGALTTAKNDLVDAYDGLAAGGNATCGDGTAGGTGNDGAGPIPGIDWTTLTPGTIDLAGKNLVPGVYCADAFTLSGTLTLSGGGG